ncbi:hypothetical protein E2C01_003013 [Portunus trituberculatus]|uniref:Uncharacterized protein n=1 Tax=Portunus trituberculatus TaxID=210409 RepID=A0A5B7CLF2_PORTR|nr:hypothetical protein [Portunus trituberculatus]
MVHFPKGGTGLTIRVNAAVTILLFRSNLVHSTLKCIHFILLPLALIFRLLLILIAAIFKFIIFIVVTGIIITLRLEAAAFLDSSRERSCSSSSSRMEAFLLASRACLSFAALITSRQLVHLYNNLCPVFHIGLAVQQEGHHFMATLEAGQCEGRVAVGLNLGIDI